MKNMPSFQRLIAFLASFLIIFMAFPVPAGNASDFMPKTVRVGYVSVPGYKESTNGEAKTGFGY